MRYSRLCPVLVALGWVGWLPHTIHMTHITSFFLAQLQEKRAGQSSKWMWTQLEDQVWRGSACTDLTFAQVGFGVSGHSTPAAADGAAQEPPRTRNI